MWDRPPGVSSCPAVPPGDFQGTLCRHYQARHGTRGMGGDETRPEHRWDKTGPNCDGWAWSLVTKPDDSGSGGGSFWQVTEKKETWNQATKPLMSP